MRTTEAISASDLNELTDELGSMLEEVLAGVEETAVARILERIEDLLVP